MLNINNQISLSSCLQQPKLSKQLLCTLQAYIDPMCDVVGHGGGWGYSAHSVEAIRFCADADILLGGLGLFGGRGEYTAKIKVSRLVMLHFRHFINNKQSKACINCTVIHTFPKTNKVPHIVLMQLWP